MNPLPVGNACRRAPSATSPTRRRRQNGRRPWRSSANCKRAARPKSARKRRRRQARNLATDRGPPGPVGSRSPKRRPPLEPSPRAILLRKRRAASSGDCSVPVAATVMRPPMRPPPPGPLRPCSRPPWRPHRSPPRHHRGHPSRPRSHPSRPRRQNQPSKPGWCPSKRQNCILLRLPRPFFQRLHWKRRSAGNRAVGRPRPCPRRSH